MTDRENKKDPCCDFEAFFAASLAAHPHMTVQDAAKLCHQASHGGEHLLGDPDALLARIREEWEIAPIEPPVEQISPGYFRLSLGGARELGLTPEQVLSLFCLSARGAAREIAERLSPPSEHSTLLRTARRLGVQGKGMTEEEWEGFLASYSGGALSHSPRYRALYRPHYRLMSVAVLPLLPILSALSGRKGGVIAIDGRCGSGKSTIAALLSELLSASVIRMDDFFLPPALRSDWRLSTPGGNIDSARFAHQVLPHLKNGGAFSYEVYDCCRQGISHRRQVAPTPFRIVEGSYSLHPRFGDYAHLRVFTSVCPEEQMRRILARNGEKMALRFADEFIPMEERYFEAFAIEAGADVVVKGGGGA